MKEAVISAVVARQRVRITNTLIVEIIILIGKGNATGQSEAGFYEYVQAGMASGLVIAIHF